MDLMGLSLAGLVAIGAVNVIDIFFPLSDSRIKFGVSFIAAFIVLFIPAELGNTLLNQVRIALQLAIGASGAYKLFQVAGTKR